MELFFIPIKTHKVMKLKFILPFLISFACFLVFRFDAKLSLIGSLALSCFVAYLVASIEEILNEL